MLETAYKKPTTVLLIEDTASDAAIIRTQLEDTGNESFTILHAPDMASAIPMLAGRGLDAVMLDLFLPDAEDLDGLSGIQTLAPDVPVLILTGREDEVLANRAVAKGAQDYLIKDKMTTESLQRSLRHAIRRKQFENVLLRQARYDTLTGLPNRDLFRERLAVVLARQQRSHQRVGLMMLDLNGFKAINDSYGHAAGDAMLREVGRRIPHCLRPYDIAARLGGDEFAVLIEDVAQNSNYAEVARKLINVIEIPHIAQAHQVSVGVSIGITVSDGSADIPPDLLLHEADIAMYRAKKNKVSSFEFFDGEIEEKRPLMAKANRA